MRYFTIALAALAVVPVSAARADRWNPADVQRAMQVADDHWPTSPCNGRHDVRWMTGIELHAAVPGLGFSAVAVSDIDAAQGCRVWIAWDMLPADLASVCTVVLHEYGHNAGLGHTDKPGDPMNPELDAPTADCKAAFPTPRRAHARKRRTPRPKGRGVQGVRSKVDLSAGYGQPQTGQPALWCGLPITRRHFTAR